MTPSQELIAAHLKRFQVAEMSIGEAAKFLRNVAQLCHNESGFNNFEQIAKQFLSDAYDAALKSRATSHTGE